MKHRVLPAATSAMLALAAIPVLVVMPLRSAAETPKLKTGEVLKRTYDFKQAKKKMEYCLYVPKAYDKAKAWPLMVALHGLYSSPWQIMHYEGLTKLADKHGYIVVAPMGYNNRGWYGSRGWTMRRSSPKDLGELSEKDVMNVLAITRKQFRIDNRRIYLMGHSMGGGGTWHLGIKYPQIWAALAPIAPAIYRSPDALAKIKSMPVILIQGDADRLVPVRIARSWAAKMKELKMDYKYIEVPGGGHVRISFDNMPQIFECFNTRQREVPAKPVNGAAKAKPDA
ncbi:MAG: PHB depolymerase family esterase [Phycisphaerae bacterium]